MAEVKAQFLPPEMFGGVIEPMPSEEQIPEVGSAWDIAIRYHELRSKRAFQEKIKHLRRLSAEIILVRAQQILGALVHPVDQRVAPLSEVPFQAEQVDLDLEETLEHSPSFGTDEAVWNSQDIWMSYVQARKQPVILSVDTSLSMTGEKLALTAVALAVVLLEFPDDPIGMIAFENEAKLLKAPEERLSVRDLIERFLDVPAQGYTHLESGMKLALTLSQSTAVRQYGRVPSTVLLTDGKYTAGKDPAYLAPRFSHLVVLKMGHERASLKLCEELAHKGHGLLREVAYLESLPFVMYGVVKDLLRGRSE